MAHRRLPRHRRALRRRGSDGAVAAGAGGWAAKTLAERLRRSARAGAGGGAGRSERRAAARMGDRNAVRFRRCGDGRGACVPAMLERLPDEEPRASRSWRWASSAAASSTIRRTSTWSCCSIPTLPRRPRDEPGEAAVRYGRRFIELLQQRTHDGYVARVDLRLRPSPEVTPIVLPVDAAISYYESSALPWERAAFIRARAAPAILRSASASSRKSSRSSGDERSISARSRKIRDISAAHPRPLCAGAGVRPRL